MDSTAVVEFTSGWQLGFSSVVEFLPAILTLSITILVAKKVFDV